MNKLMMMRRTVMTMTMTVTMTHSCKEGEFTCSDGQCIRMKERCDQVVVVVMIMTIKMVCFWRCQPTNFTRETYSDQV